MIIEDNISDDMIEVLDAFEKDSHYFADFAKRFSDSRFIYRLNLNKSGYDNIKRVLRHKSDDSMSQPGYRYFLKIDGEPDNYSFWITQFELERETVKGYKFKAEKQLCENLRLIIDVNDPNEIEHLKIET